MALRFVDGRGCRIDTEEKGAPKYKMTGDDIQGLKRPHNPHSTEQDCDCSPLLRGLQERAGSDIYLSQNRKRSRLEGRAVPFTVGSMRHAYAGAGIAEAKFQAAADGDASATSDKTVTMLGSDDHIAPKSTITLACRRSSVVEQSIRNR